MADPDPLTSEVMRNMAAWRARRAAAGGELALIAAQIRARDASRAERAPEDAEFDAAERAADAARAARDAEAYEALDAAAARAEPPPQEHVDVLDRAMQIIRDAVDMPELVDDAELEAYVNRRAPRAAPAPAPAPALEVMEEGEVDADGVPQLHFVGMVDLQAAVPAERSPREEYAIVMRHMLPPDLVAEEKATALIAAYGDKEADAVAVRALNLVVRHTILFQRINLTPWCTMVDALALLGPEAGQGMRLNLANCYVRRRLVPRGLSFAQKEDLVRMLAGPQMNDALAQIYLHSPITDWPSRPAVDHLLRTMRHVGNAGGNYAFDFAKLIVSMTTPDTAMLLPPSQEYDALLRYMCSNQLVQWESYKTSMLFRLLFVNWPTPFDSNTFPLYIPEEGAQIRSMVRVMLQQHAQTVHALKSRRHASMRTRLDAAADRPTDVQAHQCVVCMDHARSVVARPCNHAALCATCFFALKKNECPICKADMQSADPIRLP